MGIGRRRSAPAIVDPRCRRRQVAQHASTRLWTLTVPVRDPHLSPDSSWSATGTPPSISLRHIRYFLSVYEDLHFGRAAQRLQIAQPALSRAIRAVEAALGVPLFERSSRSVVPTPAGHVFAEETRRDHRSDHGHQRYHGDQRITEVVEPRPHDRRAVESHARQHDRV